MIMNFQGGRMTKWKGRAASMSPSALSISVVALVAAGAGAAHAQDIIIDEVKIEQQIIDDKTTNLTITSEGGINITGSVGVAIVASGKDIKTDVVNNGTISVSGDRTLAAGFDGYGSLSGSIANNGPITVVADATTDEGDVLAGGISVGEVADDAFITNSNTISTTVNITAVDPNASERQRVDVTGIYTYYVFGVVDNTGDITTNLNVAGAPSKVHTSFADGITISYLGEGASLNNRGAISVTTSISSAAEFTTNSAHGIAAYSIFGDSTLTNSGDIVISQTVQTLKGDAESSGSSEARSHIKAYGIYTNNITNNAKFRNSGNITITQEVSGNSRSGLNRAFGIYSTYVYDNATFYNSGDIVVSQNISGENDDNFNFTSGIYSYDIYENGTLTNNGDIVVTASASGNAIDNTVWATGISIGDVGSGASVNNNGDIVVTASASGNADNYMTVIATGIEIYDVGSGASVNNTGDIVAIANASNSTSDQDAVAIGIWNFQGRLTTEGSLIARSNAGAAYAMSISGVDSGGEVTITATGKIEGRLDLDVGELTVVSVEQTGPIYWTFEGLDTHIKDGYTTLALEDADGPALVRIGDVIATVSGPSTESQSADAEMIAQAVMLGSDKALSMLRAGGDDIATRMHTDGNGRGITAFADIDYVSRTHDAFDFDITSVTGGAMGALSNGFDYAISATGFSAKGEVTSALGASDASSSGFSLGAYSRADLGAVSLGFGATFGTATNESERLVNDNTVLGGVSALDGEFGTTFISPAVEVSYSTQMAGMAVTPRAGFRYSVMKAEAYTETGGAAAIAVDERTMNVSDFTIGVETTQAMGSGVLTASADALMRSISGDDFNVALAGVSGATTGASDDFAAIDFGIGYEMALGDGIISVGASGMVGDVEGYGISTRYEISF